MWVMWIITSTTIGLILYTHYAMTYEESYLKDGYILERVTSFLNRPRRLQTGQFTRQDVVKRLEHKFNWSS